MRDPQCERIYNWEDEWKAWNVGSLTLPACRTLVRAACDLYDVRYPSVLQHRNVELSYYDPNAARISLRPDHKNAAIALHEAAHHIIWEGYHDTVEDHGVEWLRVYLHLLIEFGVAPEIALRATLIKHGLEWPE